MSVNSVRSWQKSLSYDQEATSNPSEFVAINLDSAQESDETRQASLTLHISLPIGILIKVEATSTASSAAFIVALNKGSHSCSI